MNGGRHGTHDDNWQPATSKPGELYTVEGRIRSAGTFWRNLRRGGRRTAEQNSMIRIGLWVMAAAGAFIALIILLALL
jgi:hypothetical protein